MKLGSWKSVRRTLAVQALVLLLSHWIVPRSHGGAKVFETDDFSVEVGMRMQPRMELKWSRPATGNMDFQRDFLIRRSRIKLNGKIQTATYNFEWKTDGTDQGPGVPAAPSTQVENAYIQYPVGAGAEVRAGLYDQPFSRDRLTSDSKQLAVDRGPVSDVPDALGLADNVVGLQLQGKVRGGRVAYATGLFDNRKIAGRYQDSPMVAGRLDLNFGSTKDIFWDAHFGKDSWYSLGVDGSWQGALENNPAMISNSAAGVDGMMDIPAGPGRLLVIAELNGISVERRGAPDALDTTAWMVGAGLLFMNHRVQPIVRFDETRYDPADLANASKGTRRDVTQVGANFYRKGHTFKIQGDVQFVAGTSQAVDGARLQAQIDY